MKLAKDVADMPFDCMHADYQLIGNFEEALQKLEDSMDEIPSFEISIDGVSNAEILEFRHRKGTPAGKRILELG